MQGNATQVNVVVGFIPRRQGDFAVDHGEFANKFGKPGTVGSKIMGHGLYLTLLKGVRRQGCIRQLWPHARVQYGIRSEERRVGKEWRERWVEDEDIKKISSWGGTTDLI